MFVLLSFYCDIFQHNYTSASVSWTIYVIVPMYICSKGSIASVFFMFKRQCQSTLGTNREKENITDRQVSQDLALKIGMVLRKR